MKHFHKRSFSPKQLLKDQTAIKSIQITIELHGGNLILMKVIILLRKCLFYLKYFPTKAIS